MRQIVSCISILMIFLSTSCNANAKDIKEIGNNFDVGMYHDNENIKYTHYLDNVNIGTTQKLNDRLQKKLKSGKHLYVIKENIFKIIYNVNINIKDNFIYKSSCIDSEDKALNNVLSSILPMQSFLLDLLIVQNFISCEAYSTKINNYIRKDITTNILFNEDFIYYTVYNMIEKVDLGVTKNYQRSINHKYEVSLSNAINWNVSLGLDANLIKADIERAASKELGYIFGQEEIKSVSITLDGNKCGRYKVEISSRVKSGTISISKDLSTHAFSFDIVDGFDIKATNLCN